MSSLAQTATVVTRARGDNLPVSWPPSHHSCTTNEGQQGAAKVNKGRGKRAAELTAFPYALFRGLTASALIMLKR